MSARAPRFGRRRIERELAARGFAAEDAASALEDVSPEDEDRALAREFARIWRSLAGLTPAVRRRRAAMALARRGFSARKVSEMIAEGSRRDAID
ncbi:MAG: hypothetical protein ABR576_07545 [Thermoanaerobaculia bacterium]